MKYKTNPGCWVNKLRIFAVRRTGHSRIFLRNFAVRCSLRTRFANTIQHANNYFTVCNQKCARAGVQSRL